MVTSGWGIKLGGVLQNNKKEWNIETGSTLGLTLLYQMGYCSHGLYRVLAELVHSKKRTTQR